MVGSGEREVVVQELSELPSKGRSELGTTIGDDFIKKPEAKEDANWGLRSEMTLSKSPKRRKTLWKKRDAIPSVVTDFLVGQRITPLVSPWSTTTMRESKPAEIGRSVIRSHEICWKGREARDLIGDKGGTVGCVLALFCWHVVQSST